MKKTYRILIIEDDLITLDAYKNTLFHIQEQSEDFLFSIGTSKDCPTAYDRIIQAINGTPYDLIFLDIRLPTSIGHKIRSGEDLGELIRKEMPSAKLIVLTSHFHTAPLNAIWVKLKPDAFVVKSDITATDFISLVEKVIDNKNFYSNRITTLMRQQLANKNMLDDLDLKILLELANGSKMKELMALLPLSKSGIEKRRTIIKEKYGDKYMSDRDMILYSSEHGCTRQYNLNDGNGWQNGSGACPTGNLEYSCLD